MNGNSIMMPCITETHGLGPLAVNTSLRKKVFPERKKAQKSKGYEAGGF